MRDKFRLFIVVGKAASLITTAGCLVTLLALKLALTRSEHGTLALTAVILTSGIATWWILRKLQTDYTRRETRAVATAFAILAPVSLAIAIPLSLISGGYAEMLLGSSFAPAVAFAGIVAMTTILDFLLCQLTLWMTRRIVKLESTHS